MTFKEYLDKEDCNHIKLGEVVITPDDCKSITSYGTHLAIVLRILEFDLEYNILKSDFDNTKEGKFTPILIDLENMEKCVFAYDGPWFELDKETFENSRL